MWFKRDHRNTSLDDFVIQNREKLRRFMIFATGVVNNIGGKIEPDYIQDKDLRAENTCHSYSINGFEFRKNPAGTMIEIRYNGKTVLIRTPSKKYICYEPGDWESKLEKLMKTPNLITYASRR